MTFIDKDGDEHRLAVNAGDNLLTVAQNNDIEMEGTYPFPFPPLPSSPQNPKLTNVQAHAKAPAPAQPATS